ncbi:MAG: bifunctional precorrin-2 dehydrogenase/sirohydrochlorin ferrochelatase [Planctomycetota bacterium]|jgi:siroheme synthase-like protein|nr:bifunctional precorrin-2 dehydrogenase/sirohydrochlorin ferrochelatase [Planctomycetota bacterium]
MPHFPLFVSLAEKLCVLVGGGAVAEKRAAALLAFGAKLRVIAITPAAPIRQLAADGRIALATRPYGGADDLTGAFLVFAAVNDRAVSRTIAAEARTAGILVNVADAPELCDFYFPALVRRGNLVAGISTAGDAPAFAAQIRRELDARWSADLGEKLEAQRLARKREENLP